MERIALSILILLFTGCTWTSRAECRQLQNEGKVQATLDSCTQCVQQFGSGNVDMVNGCAIGLDAARLTVR